MPFPNLRFAADLDCDAAPAGAVVTEAVRGADGRVAFSVSVSSHTFSTAFAAAPYPFVAVLPSAAGAPSDCPGLNTARSAPGGHGPAAMIAIDPSRHDEFMASSLGPDIESGAAVLLHLPVAWRHGGALWALEAVVLAAAALGHALDTAGPLKARLLLVHGSVATVVASVGDKNVAVPPAVLIDHLAEALASGPELFAVTCQALSDQLVCAAPGAVVGGGWRPEGGSGPYVTMLALDRLAAAGTSCLAPALRDWDPCDFDRRGGPDPTPARWLASLARRRVTLARDLYVRTCTGGGALSCAEETLRAALAPEVPPVFDPDHYPCGVNANFVAASAAALDDRFGGEAGVFHDAETRDVARHRDRIAARAVGLVAGESRSSGGETAIGECAVVGVLELGCGTGLVTESLMAALRDAGCPWHIWATEVSGGFVELARRRLTSISAADLTLVTRGGVTVVDHPPDTLAVIPSDSAAVAVVVDVYHHLERPMALMREVRRVLRPGGYLLLVDFHRDPAVHTSHAGEWILKHVRAGQDCFAAEVCTAGFAKTGEPESIDGIVENYAVVFRSTKNWPPCHPFR